MKRRKKYYYVFQDCDTPKTDSGRGWNIIRCTYDPTKEENYTSFGTFDGYVLYSSYRLGKPRYSTSWSRTSRGIHLYVFENLSELKAKMMPKML